jgi:hypothetical protein
MYRDMPVSSGCCEAHLLPQRQMGSKKPAHRRGAEKGKSAPQRRKGRKDKNISIEKSHLHEGEYNNGFLH